ncbi:hypothetical protein DFH09DRAFT_1068648 [Mycena vulgaris]|nr:hypothetical protein DFH09DRAFT_1068648 [Mycena vulgaris]
MFPDVALCTTDDDPLIDSLSGCGLMEFRNYVRRVEVKLLVVSLTRIPAPHQQSDFGTIDFGTIYQQFQRVGIQQLTSGLGGAVECPPPFISVEIGLWDSAGWTFEEVGAFKALILILLDPDGVFKHTILFFPAFPCSATMSRWWDHKLIHRWLLRSIIQCLSNIPFEKWSSTETTTELGEAQHSRNNAQTGLSMGVIKSFKN